MNTNPNQLALTIDGIIIPVTPHPEHEYTLPTADVAAGYGVSEITIRRHKKEHSDELFEGKHFSRVQNLNAGNLQRVTTIWTKHGIIRLGFFIKSERAKRFRDMAEDLCVREWDQPQIEGHDMGALISVIRDLSTEVRGLRDQIASSSPWPARPAPVPVPQLLLPQLSESQAAVREKVIAWTGVAGSHLISRCLKSQRFWSHEFQKLSPPCSPRSLSRHLAAIEDRPIEISGGIAVVWRRARTGQARYWELEVANAA